jgi:hypothetical protein
MRVEAGDDPRASFPRKRLADPCRQAGVGKHRLADRDAERGGAAAFGDRLGYQQQLSELAVVAEPHAGSDSRHPPHAQLGEVGEDECRAGPPDPGRLDRQCHARGGVAVVAPQSARVVAHLRLLQQLLGQQQGAAWIADEDRLRRGRSGRSKPAGHGRRTLLPLARNARDSFSPAV